MGCNSQYFGENFKKFLNCYTISIINKRLKNINFVLKKAKYINVVYYFKLRKKVFT